MFTFLLQPKYRHKRNVQYGYRTLKVVHMRTGTTENTCMGLNNMRLCQLRYNLW